ADLEENGLLPPVDATFSFSLVGGTEDKPGTLWVGVGAEALDEVSWTSSTNGRSRALLAEALDPAANDAEDAWVTCQNAYGLGEDLGTPGQPNDLCQIPDGMCADGGVVRAIVSPGEGDLRITEALADPYGPRVD